MKNRTKRSFLKCVLSFLVVLSLSGCGAAGMIETEQITTLCDNWANALNTRDGAARRALIAEDQRVYYDDEFLFGWLDAGDGVTMQGFDSKLEDVGTFSDGTPFCVVSLSYSMRDRAERDQTVQTRLILHRNAGKWQVFEYALETLARKTEPRKAVGIFNWRDAADLLCCCLGVNMADFEGENEDWLLLYAWADYGEESHFAVNRRSGELCAVIEGERRPLSESPLYQKGRKPVFQGEFYMLGDPVPYQLDCQSADRFTCAKAGETEVCGQVSGCQAWSDDGKSLWVWNAGGSSVSRYEIGENGLLSDPVFYLPALYS